MDPLSWERLNRITTLRNAAAIGALALVQSGANGGGGIPCGYEITHIIEAPPCQLGASALTPAAISPNGQYVCGWYGSCLGVNETAFVYNTAKQLFITIPKPAGISASMANDVSDAGLVVGTHGGSAGDFGFIYDLNTGAFINIPPAIRDGTCTIASINSKAVVCGSRSIGEPLDNITNAFTWSEEAGVIDLGVMNGPRSVGLAINDANVVVGYTGTSLTSSDRRGFVHESGATTVFGVAPNAINSAASLIDNSSRIAISGNNQTNPAYNLCYLLDQGVFTLQPALSGFPTLQRRGMNNNLCAVGNSGSPSVGMQATVWFNNIPFDLEELTVPFERIELDFGRDASDTDLILASAKILNLPIGVILAPIPRLPGDADCDQDVDVDDLLHVINSWGECLSCYPDFNVDGVVNMLDLSLVIEEWTN